MGELQQPPRNPHCTPVGLSVCACSTVNNAFTRALISPYNVEQVSARTRFLQWFPKDSHY